MLTMTYHQASMHDETMRKGPWLEEEDERLAMFVELMGEKRWDSIARASGLRRSGKSCRLRWMNYLRPDLKHGQISFEEEHVILELHERWGNKWSKIARRLPGRTDNEIKNYWRTHLRKKSQAQEQDRYPGFDSTEKVQRESNDVEMNTSDNNILAQESELSSQTSSYDEYGSGKEDITKTEHSGDILGLPDLGFAMSPYENQLSDWISGSSSNNCSASSCMLDSSFRCPSWITGDGDDLWDYCSSSLWD